jgi:hypothetical protein
MSIRYYNYTSGEYDVSFPEIQIKSPNTNGNVVTRRLRIKTREFFVKTPKLLVTTQRAQDWQLSATFDDKDLDPLVLDFYNYLKAMEIWARKQFDTNLIFHSGFKPHLGVTNETYRIKLTPNGQHATQIYNELGQILDVLVWSEFPIVQHIMCLLQPACLWQNDRECGLTFNVIQLRVFPPMRPSVSIWGHDVPPPPVAPPMAPPLTAPTVGLTASGKPIPRGGVAMLPFLSSITSGAFKLKSTDGTTLNPKQRLEQGQGFEVSLHDILSIRSRLKKVDATSKAT